MIESYDVLNLEYVATKKTNVFTKIIASLLTVLFIVIPISEFITQLKPVFICTYGIVGSCGCIIGG